MRPAELDLLGLIPPPAAYAPPAYQPRPRREITTRAQDHPMRVYEGDPEPFEVEVRGSSWEVAPGFCTHVIEPAGSPLWSKMGSRSFGVLIDDPDGLATIERYTRQPVTNGDCGGALARWQSG